MIPSARLRQQFRVVVLVSCILPWAPRLILAQASLQKLVSHYGVDDPAVPAAVRASATEAKAWAGPEWGPVRGLREHAREPGGAVWLGSDDGAARFNPEATHPWDRWQYFKGRRWLQDDAVRQVLVENATAGNRSEGRTVWIRTKRGVSRIEWRPMTLAQKAAAFEQRIEDRHVRFGMVADSRLANPGDLASSRHSDSDNDGLWTAMYLGAQCFRYAVTGAAEARVRARRSVELLMRLESITGIPGFPARSFVPKGSAHDKGEWHPSSDGQWMWKGDTSSDELVGHYYGYALYFDLAAEPAEKPAIAAVVARLTDHLIRNDYDLVDVDGQPTRWGQWSERYFKTEEGKYEGPLRAIELLAFLKVAHHITGESKYEAAYQERVRRGYANLMKDYRRWPGGGEINFSDDELAYLSYDPLLRYEKDSQLRGIYLDGLRFTWGQIRGTFNPLWNYISVASGAGPMTPALRDESRRTLERIPNDQVKWTMKNSHRLDVTLVPARDRFERVQLKEVLAPDERAVEKWNSNPFIPDGGHDGRSEDDGGYFLLPYWMGRYLKALD